MTARPGRGVFINCPFDRKYQPLLEAIVFCVTACGFRARCTLDDTDVSKARIDIIYNLIRDCHYSIHDLSRTEVDDQPSKLPRFNMPLELGIFLGAKKFGRAGSRKRCLIMDRSSYRYDKFISDIGGLDLQSHNNSPRIVIRRVRDWFQSVPGKASLPGGDRIWKQYRQFRRELPIIADEAELDSRRLTFIDYLQLATTWLPRNRRVRFPK